MKFRYRITSIILGILAVACLVFTCNETVIDADAAKSNKQIQGEIDTLNGRMSSITKEQKSLKNKIAQAQSDASNLAADISDLNYEIALLDEQILVTDALIEQYELLTKEQETQIADLEVTIGASQKVLDETIRLSFEYSGMSSAIEFIFSAEDFGDLLSRIDLLGYHLSYTGNVIEKHNKTLVELEETKESYDAAKLTLTNFRNEQDVQKGELETKISEAEIKKAQILADAEQYEKDLAEKQKYINQLDSEIKALAKMLAKEESSAPYSGTFKFPLPSGVYRITSYYGNRKDPFTGKTAYHSGYDFACAKGTPIYAADSGTVVIAQWNGGYGNCVTINHGGGIMTLYGHCSELLVKAGQKVSRGDVIAKVGTTGRSTGNHLHFEVRKNGAVSDPSPYIGL